MALIKTNRIENKAINSNHLFHPLFVIVTGLVALILAIVVSISLGAADIKLTTIWNAISN